MAGVSNSSPHRQLPGARCLEPAVTKTATFPMPSKMDKKAGKYDKISLSFDHITRKCIKFQLLPIHYIVNTTIPYTPMGDCQIEAKEI